VSQAVNPMIANMLTAHGAMRRELPFLGAMVKDYCVRVGSAIVIELPNSRRATGALRETL